MQNQQASHEVCSQLSQALFPILSDHAQSGVASSEQHQ